MDPLCDHCGKELDDKKIVCSGCNMCFCNEDCKEKQKKEWCQVPSDKLVKGTLNTFGISDDKRHLPMYNDHSIMTLPGPVNGPIPSTLRAIDSPSGKKVIDAWTLQLKKKTGRTNLSLPGVKPYYLVDIADLPRAFFIQLTEAQRNQMASLLTDQVTKLAT